MVFGWKIDDLAICENDEGSEGDQDRTCWWRKDDISYFKLDPKPSSKTAPLLGPKSIVFRLIYYAISVSRGQIIPLFCSKNAPVISFLVVL